MASSTTSTSADTPNHNPFALIDPTGVIAHNPHFAPIGLTVPIGSTGLTALTAPTGITVIPPKVLNLVKSPTYTK